MNLYESIKNNLKESEFQVEIKETLTTVVNVDAENAVDAEAQAEAMYDQQEVVLDSSNFVGAEFNTIGELKDSEEHKEEDIDSDKELNTVADHVEENMDDEEEAIEKYTDFVSFVKENKPKNADKIIAILSEIIKDEEDHINKLVGIDNNNFDVKDQDDSETIEETDAGILSFSDLSEEQKRELKERYFVDNKNDVSWGDLANIDNKVSDEELEKEFNGMTFTKDDFFTSMNESDNVGNKETVDRILTYFNKQHKDVYTLKSRVEDGTIKIYDEKEQLSYADTGYEMDGSEFGIDEPIYVSGSVDDIEELKNYLIGALKKDIYLEEESPSVFVVAIDTEEGTDTLKESSENPMYVNELPEEEIQVLKKAIKKLLVAEGYTGDDLITGVNNALDSKLFDVKETIEKTEDAEANNIINKYVFLTQDMHDNIKAEIEEEHAGVEIKESAGFTIDGVQPSKEEFISKLGEKTSFSPRALEGIYNYMLTTNSSDDSDSFYDSNAEMYFEYYKDMEDFTDKNEETLEDFIKVGCGHYKFPDGEDFIINRI